MGGGSVLGFLADLGFLPGLGGFGGDFGGWACTGSNISIIAAAVKAAYFPAFLMASLREIK